MTKIPIGPPTYSHHSPGSAFGIAPAARCAPKANSSATVPTAKFTVVADTVEPAK